jgi:electron transfer flavoprotein beta subunit
VRIVVCIKAVPKIEEVTLDPETKMLDRAGVENILNPPDKNAIEMAVSLKEKHGGEVVLLSMGPPFFDAFMRLGVAMGADRMVLLSDRAFAGADTYPTSRTLAKGVECIGKWDLVLCGEETADSSTGQVPPGIAEWLGVPQITYVSELWRENGHVRGKRSVSGGHETVEVPTPAVVSVELGANSPRFPDFDRLESAKKELRVDVWTAKDVGLKERKRSG